MSLQIEALSPIMWTIIIAVALVLIAAVVFTWKSSAMSTRKMVTIAMLTAVYVVLNFAGTVRLGWINISVASLPVIVGAMLYGPVGGLLVGLLGAFMGQLLTYGVTATTILWILPQAARGLLVGVYAKHCGYKFSSGQLTLALIGTALANRRAGKHLITTGVEHPSIYNTMSFLEEMGFEVTYIRPTSEGYIRPEDVEAAIRPDTALVSIMMANNEIGTIQPIKEIAEIAHKHGVWMHTDAVQAVGAIPVDVKELGVDMLSMSAHKFNGPKGMGALYCRKGVWPQNLIDGGSQEARHRAGTENVAGIAAMGKALEIATAHLDERMAHESELRDYVIDRILKNIPEARLNGGRAPRLPGNVNISFPGLEGETILLDLDMHGICASTGSACNSDSLDPSHVLLAIGRPHEVAHGSLRLSLCEWNTEEEVDYMLQVIPEVVEYLRGMSPVWKELLSGARQFIL